ncbi:MAG: hypothetical protein WC479_03140 [Candidatus Izemoplasmatales bacterium]
MKLKTIVKIVCANVPKSTNPKELYRIFLEVVDSLPDDEEEVINAIDEATGDGEEIGDLQDEDTEEGGRQDPTFKSAVDEDDN